MRSPNRLLRSSAVLLAVVAVGCGSAEREEGETSPEGPPASAPAETTGTTGSEGEASTTEGSGGGQGIAALARQISDDPQEQPEIPAGEGPPPSELVTRDIIEGKGQAAQRGDTISVQYVGALYDSGEKFDASYDRGEPFQFQLGAGQVIPGWDEGLVGAKEGSRRLLVIPAEQAYGAQGSPPAIPPNATLSFVVDVVEVGG